MKKAYKIGEAELEVMKAVWDKVGPVSSTDIVRQLKSQCGWEETTIYTMLSKLVKKGFLNRDKQAVSYYSPLLTENEYRLEQTHNLVDRLFGGDSRTLLSMLVQSEEISSSDLEELRQFWKEDSHD